MGLGIGKIRDINEITHKCLGVVFTEDYIEELLRTPHLEEYLWKDETLDSRAKSLIIEEITYDLTGNAFPHDGSTEEEFETFMCSWYRYLKTADSTKIDIEQTNAGLQIYLKGV